MWVGSGSGIEGVRTRPTSGRMSVTFLYGQLAAAVVVVVAPAAAIVLVGLGAAVTGSLARSGGRRKA